MTSFEPFFFFFFLATENLKRHMILAIKKQFNTAFWLYIASRGKG
jgi:hypothetical protein